MKTIFTKSFALAAGERALKTFAQALLALFTAGVTVFDVDLNEALAVSATAALVSVLTSIVSAPFGPDGSPSLVEYQRESEPAV